MTEIKITRVGEYLEVQTSFFDEDLRSEIKTLDYRQREWKNGYWKILECDPNQEPEQESNLEFVRRIAAECSIRRGWKLYDYTEKSKEEIARQKQQDEQECHEAHVCAVLKVLDKLPRRVLKLVRWEDKLLKLQLVRFLGDEEGGYDLFMELFNACTYVWKPSAIASSERKMSSTFVFEMFNDERIVRKLAEIGVENLKSHSLSISQAFNDGVAHLIDKESNHWVGCDCYIIDIEMSELNYSSHVWQIAVTDEHIYWVAQTMQYIQGWLEESPMSWMFFGGAFGVARKNFSKIPELIECLHLEEWFRDWGNSLLFDDEIVPCKHCWDYPKRKATGWNHASDQLTAYLGRFPENLNFILDILQLSAEQFNARILGIQAKKAELAANQVAEDRANAFELAKERTLNNAKNKDELIKLAGMHGVVVSKHWSRDAIINAFKFHPRTCEKLIGLANDD